MTFYLATISFAFGIFVRSFLEFGMATITWLALMALIIAMFGRRKLTNHFFFISVVIFCFSLGALRMEVASWSENNPTLEAAVGQEVSLNGFITREPEVRTRSTHLYVETEYGTVLAFAPPSHNWRYGETVEITGQLEKPEAFETDLGRTFNYPGYLLARDVSYIVRYAEVSTTGAFGGLPVFAALYDLKSAFIGSLRRFIPEPSVALGEGLLLGVKSSLGDELETVFRRSGIIHIVVLSGYNVMLVVAFVLFVLGNLLGRKLSTILGLVGIALFAILVGLSATVVRASLMAGLLLLLGLTGRVYLILRGLCLAGVLMLLWNPYALVFDVGFQLSFLATLGLILVSPYLQQYLEWFPNVFGTREFLVATLATQLFVLPLLLFQIGELSIVSVIVNVLVLPMVPVAMLLTFISGLLGAVSYSLAEPIAYLAHLSLVYIIKMAEFFASWQLASFTVPAFPFWVVPVSYGLLAWLLWWFFAREANELAGWVIEESAS